MDPAKPTDTSFHLSCLRKSNFTTSHYMTFIIWALVLAAIGLIFLISGKTCINDLGLAAQLGFVGFIFLIVSGIFFLGTLFYSLLEGSVVVYLVLGTFIVWSLVIFGLSFVIDLIVQTATANVGIDNQDYLNLILELFGIVQKTPYTLSPTYGPFEFI